MHGLTPRAACFWDQVAEPHDWAVMQANQTSQCWPT